MGELLQQVVRSALAFFVVPAVVLLVCAEVGFRLGLRVREKRGEAPRATIGGIQGAVLGLLGLLLGFTFAMAAARYEGRRELIVKEANAIGTTFLRASLLPEAHVKPVEDLLRRYVALRIEIYPLTEDAAALADGLRRSAEMQRELWRHAVESAREAPTPVVATFIASLNETIDTEAERLATGRARIPGSIWVLLLAVSSLGCLTSSYVAGTEGMRSPFASVMFPLLIAVVMTLVFDLMHPLRGFIGLSQQPLVDVQASMQPGGG